MNSFIELRDMVQTRAFIRPSLQAWPGESGPFVAGWCDYRRILQTYRVVGGAIFFSMQCDMAGLQRTTEARGLLIDWSTSDGVASGLESVLLLLRLQVWQWALPDA